MHDSNGFCIPAGVNEPGELVGEIPDEFMVSKYTDANAASKKVFVSMLKFNFNSRLLPVFQCYTQLVTLGVAWG